MATTKNGDGAWATEKVPLLDTPIMAHHDCATQQMHPEPSADAKFSTGLLNCCAGEQACQICMISTCVPCFAHGIIADDASGGRGQKWPCALFGFGMGVQLVGYLLGHVGCPTVVPLWPLAQSSLARSKLRVKYGLPADACGDCCAHFWCTPCAKAQEIRHIRDVAAASNGVAGGQARSFWDLVQSAPAVETDKKTDFMRDVTAAYL